MLRANLNSFDPLTGKPLPTTDAFDLDAFIHLGAVDIVSQPLDLDFDFVRIACPDFPIANWEEPPEPQAFLTGGEQYVPGEGLRVCYDFPVAIPQERPDPDAASIAGGDTLGLDRTAASTSFGETSVIAVTTGQGGIPAWYQYSDSGRHVPPAYVESNGGTLIPPTRFTPPVSYSDSGRHPLVGLPEDV